MGQLNKTIESERILGIRNAREGDLVLEEFG